MPDIYDVGELLLDVAAYRYGSFWWQVRDLFDAMNTMDGPYSRGWLTLTKAVDPSSLPPLPPPAPPPDGRAIFECVGRVPEEDAVKVVACFAEP